MTVDTAILNFVNIYIANNKTNACLKDDLRFLTFALQKPNRIPKTILKVFKYVKHNINFHMLSKICAFFSR